MNLNTKTLSALLVSLLIGGSYAFAGCEDGSDIAETEALVAAKKHFGTQCKIVGEAKKTLDWPSEGLEGYQVGVNCKGQPRRTYSVTLVEIEDAWCKVKRTKLLPMSGAQCGLSDTWGGDEGAEWNMHENRQLAVYKMSPAKLRKLPPATQAQLILTAGVESKNDVVKAVEFLKENSEAEEVYVEYFEFKGVEYASVRYFGGGNPVGLIFKDGSIKPVAENGDDSLSCL